MDMERIESREDQERERDVVDDRHDRDRDPPAPIDEVKDSLTEYKCFVGGLPWQIGEPELKAAFSRYNVSSCVIMMDKFSGKSRGFGFVYFMDEAGQDEAIKDMHANELEGRKISVVKAVPMDQTKPGTPAGVLGAGPGSRVSYVERGPRGGRDRDRDRGYDRDRGDRHYDRDPPRDRERGGYDRDRDRGYDRGGGGGDRYDRYEADRAGPYGGQGYGVPPSYPRDPYPPRGPAYFPPGPGGGYPGSAYAPPPGPGGYDRAGGYDSYGPDRSRAYAPPPRSGPYDERDRRR